MKISESIEKELNEKFSDEDFIFFDKMFSRQIDDLVSFINLLNQTITKNYKEQITFFEFAYFLECLDGCDVIYMKNDIFQKIIKVFHKTLEANRLVMQQKSKIASCKIYVFKNRGA